MESKWRPWTERIWNQKADQRRYGSPCGKATDSLTRSKPPSCTLLPRRKLLRAERKSTRSHKLPFSCDAQLALHFFERDAFGLRVYKKDHEELHHHHGREEDERIASGLGGHKRKAERDGTIHEPMGKTAEALAIGTHAVGENFADVNPDDRSLGECKESDEANEKPDQESFVPMSKEDGGDAGQTDGCAHGAGEQHLFPAEAVDDGHGNHREEKIRGSDGDSLKVRGDLAEACAGKDVVEVVEDGVDAGKLVEHADGDGEENRQAVFPREQMIFGDVVGVDRCNNVLQLPFIVFLARELEDLAGYLNALLLDQPAWAARNTKEHDEENCGGDSGNAQLPAPLGGAGNGKSYEVIGQVCKENAKDNVELKKTDQAAASLGRRNLSDVHGTEDGSTPDTEAADKAKKNERVPVPSE